MCSFILPAFQQFVMYSFPRSGVVSKTSASTRASLLLRERRLSTIELRFSFHPTYGRRGYRRGQRLARKMVVFCPPGVGCSFLRPPVDLLLVTRPLSRLISGRGHAALYLKPSGQIKKWRSFMKPKGHYFSVNHQNDCW